MQYHIKQGLKHGLTIGFFGALAAGFILHFILNGGYIAYPIALAVLLPSGAIVGPRIGKWIYTHNWKYPTACSLGAFFILIWSAFFAACGFSANDFIDRSINPDSGTLPLLAFGFTILLGILPAMFIGLVYGFILKATAPARRIEEDREIEDHLIVYPPRRKSQPAKW